MFVTSGKLVNASASVGRLVPGALVTFCVDFCPKKGLPIATNVEYMQLESIYLVRMLTF